MVFLGDDYKFNLWITESEKEFKIKIRDSLDGILTYTWKGNLADNSWEARILIKQGSEKMPKVMYDILRENFKGFGHKELSELE